MERLKERFDFVSDAEVAIEIDPTSLPPDRREALRPMGVTRVSLGLQDLEPAVQRAIGREQSYEESEACADEARRLAVASLNLDLIYGLPLQTEEGVARTARRTLDLKADRVAVFGYAHVPWMKRHQALIPEEQLPGPVERYAQLNAIHRVLTLEGGYVAVGLDHYALPSDAMAKAAAARRLKRSFQGYTTDAAPALIGFGASSIGSLPQGYVQNAPTAAAYARSVEWLPAIEQFGEGIFLHIAPPFLKRWLDSSEIVAKAGKLRDRERREAERFNRPPIHHDG